MSNNSEETRTDKEIAWYKSQVNTLSGAIIGLEYKIAEMSNEIKQMRKGFGLIAGLQQHKHLTQPEDLFDHFTEQINVQMQMHHSLVLLPLENGLFQPAHLKGYSVADASVIREQTIEIPSSFLSEKRSLLVNSIAERDAFVETLSAALQTKYFILTPVIVQEHTIAFLFTGRTVEVLPLAASRLLIHDLHALEAMAGVIAAVRNQLDQFKMLEAERTRIAREMHDEIGAELTKIRLYSQLLLRDNVDQEHGRKLAQISAASLKVLESVSEIIWAMNSWNDNLDNLASYVRRYAAEYCEAHDISFLDDFPDDFPDVFISSNYRRNTFLIVKEALHNVVKHALATRVMLRLSYNGQVLEVEVADNGKGLPDKAVTGNGLLSMQHRAEALGGTLKLSSRGEGCVVCFTLRLNDAAVSAHNTFV